MENLLIDEVNFMDGSLREDPDFIGLFVWNEGLEIDLHSEVVNRARENNK